MREKNATRATKHPGVPAAVLAAALLAACGGGGGDGGDPSGPGTGPAPGVEQVQGFWSGAVDAQTTASAVVLPDGTVWNLLATANGAANALVRGSTTVTGNAFTVTGQRYAASGGMAAYGISGTVVPKATLTVAAVPGAAGYTLSYNKAYETPARLADAEGRWNASFGTGTVRLTLDVGASGALSGTSTAGCRYSGNVAPHAAGVAVFNLSLTENCPGEAAQQFAGIATLNAARTALSAAFTTANGSAAGLFQATR